MAPLDEWSDAIHLIGAGGIGTHVLLALIELGAREVNVWDDDIVAPHNRPTQFVYSKSDIGKPKVAGMQRFVEAQGYDTVIKPHYKRVDAKTKLQGVVISGVDTMASRNNIWQALKYNPFVPLYIDGRVGDAYVHVMTIEPCNPTHIERYESTFFDDTAATDLSCSTRENPHSALAVAQMVSMNFSLFLQGEDVKDAVYRNLRHEAASVQ